MDEQYHRTMPTKKVAEDDQRPWMSRKILGQRLRRLRDHTGKTRADVAEARGGISIAHLRRIEAGQVPVHIRNVKTLCDIYQIHDEDVREKLCDLAEATRNRVWSGDYNLPFWMELLTEIESHANVIHHYLEHVIDGRFQTKEYAWAVTDSTLQPGLRCAETIEKVVDFRMSRKEKFWSSGKWRSFKLVFNESAIMTQVGGPEIHRSQIDHLLEISERPGVTVSVVPHSAGPYFGIGTPLMVFDFDDKTYPSVAWKDEFVRSGFNDEVTVVERYREMWQSAADRSVSLKRFINDYWQ